MTESSDVGAFVCSCADTCDIDLDDARERIDGVAMAASSDLLCEKDTVEDICAVVEERDLSDVIVTCPATTGQDRLARIERETDAEVTFVDQREGAGWVHDERAATEKTSRLVASARAGLDVAHEEPGMNDQIGTTVAVVGDAQFAAALPDAAEVTLIADGNDLDEAALDLDSVRLERGRVVGVTGSLGDIELTLSSRVTEDCIDCMECIEAGPDGAVTRTPVDVDPEVESGSWVDICPTDAIELDGVTRTLSFDQVVHPSGSDDTPGGTTGYHTAADLPTIATVSNLLGNDPRPSFLDFDMDVCASGDSGEAGCRICHDVCPHDAVSKPAADSVSFNEAACQNCGACTSGCPTGAVELNKRPNKQIAREVEALLAEEPTGGLFDRSGPAIETQVVAFVCSERAQRTLRRYGRVAARGEAEISYPPVLPVEVNCTDTVGEAHVLHALAAGADGVAIFGCGSSCLHSGPDPKAALVERLNQATTDLGLDNRVAFFAPDPDEPQEFCSTLSQFVLDLDVTPVPADEYESTGGTLVADEQLPEYGNRVWALENVRAILEYVEPQQTAIRGLESFGRMTVSDACGFTPTCETLCPTGAIRRTDEQLQFNHERCINCGLCESGCPERAITMETGLDLELLPEQNDDDSWTTIHEDELFECRRCGEPFVSAATVENMKEQLPDGDMPTVEGHMAEYCSECKGELTFGG